MGLNRYFFQRWHTNSHQVCKILVNINVLCFVTQLYLTLCDPMDCSPPGFSVHEDSAGQNTDVGSLSLLQGIFPTQGSNTGLPRCRQILYHLNHQASPIFQLLTHLLGQVICTLNLVSFIYKIGLVVIMISQG